ncbi:MULTISPECIES: nitrogen fixation protein NifQ [unclassified Uliginosibacterium]|uniref:nitrogen fixation protein NifQ n=1 Tax=unclassified Uliginosibacterium TaxID=2621521 RepID=UPI000C7D6FCB|nr:MULTISPECIES: nitrogen fixation protein NifQ [unclassified Uliginosibacterium]MDO6388088.1 nitrogen fixation protein NifQ [Uliginosibacterium sp. 31-12]PLK48332.1 hydrogenase [Uliginosibacterium sp. TH139]
MNAVATDLIRLIDQSPSLEVLVLRCVLAESQRAGERPLIRGIGPASFAVLRETCLPGVELDNADQPAARFDEFEELFELLLDYAAPLDPMSIWLAAAIATAAQRDNHLWQDMGLPSRRELNALLRQRFPSLAALNVGDMKWKKFFYRQLCERAGVPICKSPSCGVCVDHPVCFGPEV